MRSDLITPATRLQRATKKVQDKWREARSEWDDNVSQRFQEKYLEPIVPQMQLTLAAIHELMQVLEEAQAETEDDQ